MAQQESSKFPTVSNDVKACLIKKLAKKKKVEQGFGASASVESEVFSCEKQCFSDINQESIVVDTPMTTFVELFETFLNNTKRPDNTDARKV